MITGRSSHAMVVCNGCLFAIGGTKNSEGLKTVEKLSELEEEWKNVQPMHTPRHDFAAVCFKQVIYAIDGCSHGFVEKSVEKFVPAENKWSFVSDMNSEHSKMESCSLCVAR